MSKKEKKEKKGFFKEFGEFINRGNALALAIGVIIGGAFTSIVTAINKNIISPIIAWIIGDTDLSNSLVTVLKSHDIATQADVANGLATAIGDPLAEPVNDIVISWGALIQAVIDFILIALILFLIMKVVTSILNRAKEVSEKFKKQKEEAEAESTEESEKPAEPEKKEVPADIALLTEIRDLLKSNASTTSEAETEKNN
ncbi:MAG: large conductance mechanosensitive channel protein MscL [Bacilli bacterium]